MAFKPKIPSTFWQDPHIEALPAEGKLTAIWFETNADIIGFCEKTPMRFSFDAGLKPEIYQQTCQALSQSILPVDGGVWLRNYIRRQHGDGDSFEKSNIFWAVLNKIKLVTDDKLKGLIFEAYPVIREHLTGKTLALPKLSPSPCKGDVSAVEAIYAAYPRKVAKPAALRAISKAVEKFEAPNVLARTIEFAKLWLGNDLAFCPHPATWFNQERFNDDPSTWGPKGFTVPLHIQQQNVEKAIEIHPANKESIKFDPRHGAEAKVELRKLLARRDELIRQIANGGKA
jgi:hypothetical protein